MTTITKGTLTCPRCGFKQESEMPTDACQFFHECVNCKTILKPLDGDCCVYCSFGDTLCPIKQAEAFEPVLDSGV